MSHFDVSFLQPDPERRGRVLPILAAALDAVEPAQAVNRAVRWEPDAFWVEGVRYGLDGFRRIVLLAFGKAATPMAQAVAHGLGHRLDHGLVITKYGHGPEDAASWKPLTVVEAAHPVPDAQGVAAARRAVEMAAALTENDLLITLISGGGSALLTLPASGLTLTDLQRTTDLLLASGATIHEINAVRKHLSQVKGGQLARLASPARVLSLILSDVIGNPLDVIASGPTAPDPTTWADAWAVIQKYALETAIPPAVRERLQAGLAGQVPDTPKPGDPLFRRVHNVIIGDNAIAAEAARKEAENQGFHAAILSTFVQGEAREVAQVLVALGREIVAHGRPLSPPACLILGGETTVTLRGDGKGGRNQELALAAGIALAQIPEADPILIISLGTDGTDGPTDAAGGLADATTVARGRALGLDAQAYLAQNNSYPYLQAVHDLVITGPTRTNVNDLMFIFVLPSRSSSKPR
ncbi:MAG TPA: glycerate kinase [Anaerolineae bacterium]|nr:glycerate kinase [Anaerolineae bacterium]